MKYYAHFGHDDFILCLGYGDQQIKDYFLDYKEWDSNDFSLSRSSTAPVLHQSDLDGWRITFVNTGLNSEIGERLRRVRHLLGVGRSSATTPTGSPTARSTPSSTSIAAPAHGHHARRPADPSMHVIDDDESGRCATSDRSPTATSGSTVATSSSTKRSSTSSARRGPRREAVPPTGRTAQALAYRYDGRWVGIDTFKERQEAEDLWSEGKAWWAVWRGPNGLQSGEPVLPHTTTLGAGEA